MTPDAAIWDARAEAEVGLLIVEYMDRNPAPLGALIEGDLLDWAWRLQHAGRQRLQALEVLPDDDEGDDA